MSGVPILGRPRPSRLKRLLGIVWAPARLAKSDAVRWQLPSGDGRQLWKAVEARRACGVQVVPAELLVTSTKAGKRSLSKRLVFAVGYAVSLAAVVALIGGATYGFLSATSASGSNVFSAGSVTQDSDATGTCNVSNLLPDGSETTCTLKATYTGSVPGYVGLDILIETQHAAGGSNLYKPTDSANDLQVAVSSTSPSVAYTVPASTTPCPAGAPVGSACYEIDKELVATTAFANGSPQIVFTTTLSLPTTSTTDYQGGAAQIIITAHATQAGNNGSTAGCSAGDTCNGVSWS